VPAFQPRNRTQIIRDMVARVIGRSRLSGLTRNSVIFHALAAASNEDAEQYIQMARLRSLFSVDKATGSDLDQRAAEILPGTLVRRGALFASTTVIFSRPGTTGTVTIPAGTQVGGVDDRGTVRYRTTAAGSILGGNTQSAAIPVTATTRGTRANLGAGTIVRILDRVAGVTAVTNPAAVTNGVDRESDASFRRRLKGFVQSMSRGTPVAIESAARNVALPDGSRVVFAQLVEPVIPNGVVELFVDNGAGSIETFDSSFLGTPDLFLPSAVGGETLLQLSQVAVRDDGSFVLELDAGGGFVTLVRGTDYELNAPLGVIELAASLSAGDAVRASYRYYTGLIGETQRVIDGVSGDPTRQGVRPAGVLVEVKPATLVAQTVTATIAVEPDFDPTAVAASVSTALQDYINNLDIGEDVIVAEIIERSMAVTGMRNISVATPAADVIILGGQVARIDASNITLV
jgi:uncharacterized phage protein gp47/JayE